MSTMVTALAVLFAGLLHAVWNALAKAVPDRYTAFAVMGAASALVSLPVAVAAGPPAGPAWPFLLTSVVLQVAYTALLIRSYDLGDFGQVYPLARGSAPFLVAVAGAVLGERLSPLQSAGLVVVCGGLVALAIARHRTTVTGPAVTAALLTGLSIAAYTVVDGLGVRRTSHPLPYIAWLFLLEGSVVALMALAVRGRAVAPALRTGWQMPAAGGIVSLLAYAIVVWAQTRSPLAQVAALRETSVVWGAIIGAVFFSERFGWRRVAAAVTVTLGIIMLTAPT